MKKKILILLMTVALCVSITPIWSYANEQELKPNVQVDIIETNIEADRVFNTSGYGSLQINAVQNIGPGIMEIQSYPKAALIDYTGQLVFPYKDTWLRYSYSDGVVSLTADDLYQNWRINSNYDMPGFYYLDGTEVFQNNYLCAEEKEAEIREKDEAIREKDEVIKEQHAEIIEKDEAIKEQHAEIKEKDKVIREKDEEIKKLKAELNGLRDEETL